MSLPALPHVLELNLLNSKCELIPLALGEGTEKGERTQVCLHLFLTFSLSSLQQIAPLSDSTTSLLLSGAQSAVGDGFLAGAGSNLHSFLSFDVHQRASAGKASPQL